MQQHNIKLYLSILFYQTMEYFTRVNPLIFMHFLAFYRVMLTIDFYFLWKKWHTRRIIESLAREHSRLPLHKGGFGAVLSLKKKGGKVPPF